MGRGVFRRYFDFPGRVIKLRSNFLVPPGPFTNVIAADGSSSGSATTTGIGTGFNKAEISGNEN